SSDLRKNGRISSQPQPLQPICRKSEDFYRGEDEMHGAGGEWRIEKARVRWAVLDAFQQEAREAGIPETADFKRGSNEGSGYFDVNQ
ncbi:hypothetical protein AB9E28_34975, partial [Rhizobium leguminosarum]